LKTTSQIFALACSFVASVAQADSPESFSKVTSRSAGSNVVGLTAMYGTQNLLYSKDGGKTFGALCKAFGPHQPPHARRSLHRRRLLRPVDR
jgi:hypothetical protein